MEKDIKFWYPKIFSSNSALCNASDWPEFENNVKMKKSLLYQILLGYKICMLSLKTSNLKYIFRSKDENIKAYDIVKS